MKYDLDWLKKSIEYGKSVEYVFFYSHKRSETSIVDKNSFSQFWSCEFMEDEIRFCCAEQYMMYQKALLFEDYYIAEQIINEISPYKIQKLGRKVSNFRLEIWDENKFDIVAHGNFLKFDQNKELKDFLLSTTDKVLVEAAQYDTIWGIGMKESHKDIENPYNWNGLNLLGFALMEARSQIIKH